MDIIKEDDCYKILEIVNEFLPYVSMHNIKKLLSKGYAFYILYNHNKSIGCVSVSTVSNVKAKIEKLYIKPDYRKLGYGESLLKKCEEFALNGGYKKLTLGMDYNKKALLNWYEINGFKQKRVKGIKKRGIEVCFMEKLLYLE